MRILWQRIHRYAGLAMAAFLVIAGLTGSIIAFQWELDVWLNPDLFRASQGANLPLSDLARNAEKADPRFEVTYVGLPPEPGMSAELYGSPRIDPTTQQPFEIDYDAVYMDPVSGEILGRRLWGECCFHRRNLVPFLFNVHYSLHLPGSWGLWIMGLVALLWVADCFVGAYLTFPRGAPWWARWKQAWQVRTHAGSARLNFDLHRAGGLWLWVVLLMFAVSSVALNLRKEVFEPVVNQFSAVTMPIYERPALAEPRPPVANFDDAAAAAREVAGRVGWSTRVERIYYSAEQGFYGARVGERNAAGFGNRWLYFSGKDMHYLGADVPGQGTAGDVFIHLQYPLHSGRIAGLAGRIVVCVMGLLVAALSITGVVIWLRKRRVGQSRRAKVKVAVTRGDDGGMVRPGEARKMVRP
jgi:uncharacterized iron-regulated membrane protein